MLQINNDDDNANNEDDDDNDNDDGNNDNDDDDDDDNANGGDDAGCDTAAGSSGKEENRSLRKHNCLKLINHLLTVTTWVCGQQTTLLYLYTFMIKIAPMLFGCLYYNYCLSCVLYNIVANVTLIIVTVIAVY